MVPIADLNNHRAARVFVDYLNSQGIPAEVIDENGAFVVAVEDESYREAATELLMEFARDPYQAKYQDASWQSGNSDAPMLEPPQPVMGSSTSWYQKAGPATKALSLIAIVVTLITQFGSNGLTFWFTFDIDDILSGQVYRLITPIFLHFPVFGVVFLHLLFNLLWFWDFGGKIEAIRGTRSFVWVVIGSAMVSNLGQWLSIAWFADNPARSIFGGLSGVVYALLGYLWLSQRLSNKFAGTVPPGIFNFLLVWLVLGYTGLFGSVANAAHLLGLLSGLVMAWFDHQYSNKQRN